MSDFVAYAVACALGAYTHLTMVFLVLGHAVACALRLGLPRDRASAARWRLPFTGLALAALLTLALYAPLLIDIRSFFAHRTMPLDVATPTWAAKALFAGMQVGLGTAIGALASASLLGVGLWSYFRQSRFLAALFVLPGVFTVAAVLALRQPVFPRFLFFLSGFAVLVTVRGALEIGARVSRTRQADESSPPVTLVGAVLVGVMVAASAASLSYDYRYPKQDFEAALRFVDDHRRPREPVATAGGAVYPYREYYRRDWSRVRSAEELHEVRTAGERVWVIYTLADYIATGAPELMRVLREQCTVAQIFRGTVSGGDVTVCSLPAAARATATETEPPTEATTLRR